MNSAGPSSSNQNEVFFQYYDTVGAGAQIDVPKKCYTMSKHSQTELYGIGHISKQVKRNFKLNSEGENRYTRKRSIHEYESIGKAVCNLNLQPKQNSEQLNDLEEIRTNGDTILRNIYDACIQLQLNMADSGTISPFQHVQSMMTKISGVTANTYKNYINPENKYIAPVRKPRVRSSGPGKAKRGRPSKAKAAVSDEEDEEETSSEPLEGQEDREDQEDLDDGEIEQLDSDPDYEP
ncbi:hypothetical protein WR25_24913 [Diploscapter pachys]|uniref:Uncharacterized protein n=1 Tax=Diploscapter pachys TaxID=2018661 RepID=A0A2A2LCH3_9BILA|nr:hypothetical protein WR25_24913 [Diploscapter pachys]